MWLCIIGIHVWNQGRELSVYHAFPSPFDAAYETPRRVCERCGRRQYWLPGYGGSEWGCWMQDRSADPVKLAEEL